MAGGGVWLVWLSPVWVTVAWEVREGVRRKGAQLPGSYTRAHTHPLTHVCAHTQARSSLLTFAGSVITMFREEAAL